MTYAVKSFMTPARVSSRLVLPAGWYDPDTGLTRFGACDYDTEIMYKAAFLLIISVAIKIFTAFSGGIYGRNNNKPITCVTVHIENVLLDRSDNACPDGRGDNCR